MTRLLLLVSLTCLTFCSGVAQTAPDSSMLRDIFGGSLFSNKALKISLVTQTRNAPLRENFIRDNRSRVGIPNPAMVWFRENGNFTEAELIIDYDNRNTRRVDSAGNIFGGQVRSELQLGVRQGIYWTFLKKKKVNPFVGLSGSAVYDFLFSVPRSTVEFTTRRHQATLSLEVSAGVRCTLNDYLFLDFSTVLPLTEYSLGTERIADPSVPFQLQTTSYSEIHQVLGKNLEFKVGLGIRLLDMRNM